MSEEKNFEGRELSDEEIEAVAGGGYTIDVKFNCNNCNEEIYCRNTKFSDWLDRRVDNCIIDGVKCPKCSKSYTIDFVRWTIEDAQTQGVNVIKWTNL